MIENTNCGSQMIYMLNYYNINSTCWMIDGSHLSCVNYLSEYDLALEFIDWLHEKNNRLFRRFRDYDIKYDYHVFKGKQWKKGIKVYG